MGRLTEPIVCTCGHAWERERLDVYADQLELPTMVLAARVRAKGCLVFGTIHLGDQPDRMPRTRRYQAGLPDPNSGTRNVATRDVLAAYSDATHKPKGWRP